MSSAGARVHHKHARGRSSSWQARSINIDRRDHACVDFLRTDDDS